MLSSFQKVYASNEMKKIVDGGSEKGYSWFISRSIEIYMENIKKKGELKNDRKRK